MRASANECRSCGQVFGSLEAFDRHRLGDYPETGPAEYLTRVRVGLTDEDWRPELGRRCMELEEIQRHRSYARNSYGEWSLVRTLRSAEKMRKGRARDPGAA